MPDDSAPKPGHFLPGGEGETPPDPAAPPGSTPLSGPSLRTGTSLGGTPLQGGSNPLSAPTPRLGASTPAGPPQLSGSRLGPPKPDDPAAAAFKARYSPEPIPFMPKKRSKALIAGIVVGVLVVVGGGVAGAVKVLSSYDDFVANPMGTPSVKTTDDQAGSDEPTAKPTPDLVVQKENKLYAIGKLAPAGCKEPAYRPTSKENVKAYYQALLICMNKAWEPAVRKAGFDFHPPKLIMFDDGQETACGVQEKVSSYCDADGGSVAMPWEDLEDDYRHNSALARVDMADSLGYVYGVHIQNLTGIFDASESIGDTAPNAAAKLEQDRRQALQATCLSAVFLGAEKATFPIRGQLLQQWNWRSKNSGDENTEDKVRDHGSRKSVELWMTRGFSTTNPSACNTFVAAANQVS
ncbi:MAG TPA: neutral zinc metallopeptidase [Kribbella sp.]|uniref:neutral zinc metallopeptidase n=1 Tax=Kribbella sp. TaxID=1871183 RepID=UPI002D78A3EF|nr:neutral zinc metallopeptidase [Kribbella sp.]HET6297345.1 neutral zinc metallopeptidase [Kribbella sp.]